MPLSFEEGHLHVPPLEEVGVVLQKGLEKNFAYVSVKPVECPDLTEAPFKLAASGLGGSPRIADVGGILYLFPTPHKDKLYKFSELTELTGLKEAFLIGAGAGPFPYVGVNSELMLNAVTGNAPKNGSYISKLNHLSGTCDLNSLPVTEMKCALMLNMYACEGKASKVLHIKTSCRKGTDNFVSCMRKTLEEHYGNRIIGVGGVFLMSKGSAKCHVMPDFSSVPIKSEKEVNSWLKFYDMPSPMVFLSVFVSKDPGLDLRIEHTHGFGINCGGHYHFDVTPDEVEYDGYFNLAEYLFRVDRPESAQCTN